MTALTRTLGPSASANPTVSAFNPAFAAAYGRMSCVGRTPPIELMLTTEPPPASIIRAPTSDVSRNGPFRLTASVLSHSSSVTPWGFG